MTNKNLSYIFDRPLHEVTAYYVEHRTESDWIWSLCKRALLSEIFDALVDGEIPAPIFYKEVMDVIELRCSHVHNVAFAEKISGRFISFCPDATMYDGLAEEFSEGFFDVSDVPPPEFWVGIYNNELVSFIPAEFLDRADKGIQGCLGGSLVWLGDEFFVAQ